MKKNILRSIAIVLAVIGHVSVYSQNDIPQASDKYYITGATVVSQAGSSGTAASILLEDGIIKRVGNFTAPIDAVTITADSLFIYPGFIATLSNTGIKKPEESNERPQVKRTGYPPNDIAGITPEQGIRTLYKGKDKSIGAMRKNGFTVAHSVPYGRMMPGMGSVISTNGGSFEEALIAEDISLYSQWRSANRVFPATLIGIMAKWREMYRNAELALDHSKSYKLSGRNKMRPQHDAATAALFPVINKEIPVFFKAEKNLDIHRALQLQSDMGFNMVTAEVKVGDQALSKLQRQKSQVLLSLDLPKDAEEKEDDLNEEKKKLLSKKKTAIKRSLGQAGTFAKSGVPIAFSYLEVKPADVLVNVRKLIANGLSENDALAGLTSNAASTLGISSIAGSIDAGKMANLVVMTKPIFDEKSKIKMVFVDGKKHEYEVKEKKKKKAGDGTSFDLTGNWSYEIEIPGMQPAGVLNMTKSDDTYDIVLNLNQFPDQPIDVEDIEVDGNNITFAFTVPDDNASIVVNADLNFDELEFEGEVSVDNFGTFPITGNKKDPKN